MYLAGQERILLQLPPLATFMTLFSYLFLSIHNQHSYKNWKSNERITCMWHDM